VLGCVLIKYRNSLIGGIFISFLKRYPKASTLIFGVIFTALLLISAEMTFKALNEYNAIKIQAKHKGGYKTSGYFELDEILGYIPKAGA